MIEIKHKVTGAVLCRVAGSSLRGVQLQGFDLRGADLRSADLRKAGLFTTDLSGADLEGALLAGVDCWTRRGLVSAGTVGKLAGMLVTYCLAGTVSWWAVSKQFQSPNHGLMAAL